MPLFIDFCFYWLYSCLISCGYIVMSMFLHPSITLLWTDLLFATPRKPVPRFQWKLQTFFYIYCRCASHILYICIWLFSIFFAFPLFKWHFYVRLEEIPISYPQLLLNLWVDFNENFRHSSTYIGDVHLYKCYMRFDYFQLFWFLILKNGFCHTILEGVPSLIHYPSLTCEWISMKHV